MMFTKKIRLVIAVIVAVMFFSVNSAQAAITMDMSDTNNWNIRFDGPSSTSGTSWLGDQTKSQADIDGDGKQDLVFNAPRAKITGNAGAIYIIYNSLFESLSGTGNTIDLENPTNYNIRIDAPSDLSSALLGFRYTAAVDVNNNGKIDLIVSAPVAGNNNRSASGSIYVIYDISTKYSGTGNNVDLASGANYNLRFDGALANNSLGTAPAIIGDLNNNGVPDITCGISNGVYIIYDSIISRYAGVGNNIDLLIDTNYNAKLDFTEQGVLNHMNMRVEDINNDYKLDLLIPAIAADYNQRINSGSLYILHNSLVSQYLTEGLVVDMTVNSNYSLRIDGPEASVNFGFSPAIGDLDHNGSTDLIVSASSSDNNNRIDSGSVWVIYDSILNSYEASGSILDLSISDNYNLRFDGATAGDKIGNIGADIQDINNDEKKDIILSASFATNNSRSQSGAMYIIYNSVLSNYSGTGKNADLSDTENYSLRFDGANAEDYLSEASIYTLDLNADGSRDYVIGAYRTDYNSRTDSGSVYIVYNFPHTITATGPSGTINLNSATITGTVSAPNSVTSVAGVEYSVDDNSPLATSWQSCSGTTSYTCSLTNLSRDARHTVYVRAVDTNGAYTAQSSYQPITFCVGSCPPTVAGESPTPAPATSSNPSTTPTTTTPYLITSNRQASLSCETYTVLAGDSLWAIASSVLGDGTRYKEIVEANLAIYPTLATSTNLEIGWELKVNCMEDSATQVTESPTSYSLIVRVVDSHNNPVQGAQVTVHPSAQKGVTDKDGFVEFKNVDTGENTIVVSLGKYKKEQHMQIIKDAQEETIIIDRGYQSRYTSQIMLFIAIVSVVLALILIYAWKRS